MCTSRCCQHHTALKTPDAGSTRAVLTYKNPQYHPTVRLARTSKTRRQTWTASSAQPGGSFLHALQQPANNRQILQGALGSANQACAWQHLQASISPPTGMQLLFKVMAGVSRTYSLSSRWPPSCIRLQSPYTVQGLPVHCQPQPWQANSVSFNWLTVTKESGSRPGTRAGRRSRKLHCNNHVPILDSPCDAWLHEGCTRGGTSRSTSSCKKMHPIF